MPSMTPKKNLSTELKDLDVDRVDGVDRPATGRAFALYKSADEIYADDAAHIAAVLKRLYPNAEETVKRLIEGACDHCIVKCVDANDKTVGYIVRGAMTSPSSLDACVVLIEKIIRGEIAKGRKLADKPDPYAPQEDELPPTAAGVQTPLVTDDQGGDLDHLGNPKRPSLWERHTNRGAMLDGQRMPDGKTVQERSRKQARILHNN